MYVKIGPYKNWWGPYQISKLLKYVGVSEEKCDIIGDKLAEYKSFVKLCNWAHGKRDRKIKVRIDDYDTWSADHTLSLIITPLLLKLKDAKCGAPIVDDEDVPDELKSTSAPAKENEWDIDDNHFKRWDYVLDEMIFAFSAVADDRWEEQFHSGKHDYIFVECEDSSGYSKMEKGPNNTYVFDLEKYTKMLKRIQNGHQLFGKYYGNLWS